MKVTETTWKRMMFPPRGSKSVLYCTRHLASRYRDTACTDPYQFGFAEANHLLLANHLLFYYGLICYFPEFPGSSPAQILARRLDRKPRGRTSPLFLEILARLIARSHRAREFDEACGYRVLPGERNEKLPSSIVDC